MPVDLTHLRPPNTYVVLGRSHVLSFEAAVICPDNAVAHSTVGHCLQVLDAFSE